MVQVVRPLTLALSLALAALALSSAGRSQAPPPANSPAAGAPAAQPPAPTPPDADAAAEEAGPPEPAEVPQDELLKANGDLPDLVVGNADAKITIVEYASLSCTHCAAFHTKVFPELKTKYLDTGKARLIIREFPTSERALVAAMLTRCAPPDQAVALLSDLFHKQETWAFGDAPKDKLKELSLVHGLTDAKFEDCVKDQALFDKLVKIFSTAGDKFVITGTPTFFINGKRLQEAPTIEGFDKALAAAAP